MPLFVVASPIGNLEDITQRALNVLRTCAVIASEDTRRTRKLLAHFGIHRQRLVSLYEANEQGRIPSLLSVLAEGGDVAVISDAGTPCVSDPGFRLIRAAIEADHRVVPIPGASAVLAALVASGLPTDSFRFVGFLPRTSQKRRRTLEPFLGGGATTLIFESPNRVVGLLDDVAALAPERQIAVAREVTKRYEEFLRGTAAEVATILRARDSVKGEITVVIAGAGPKGEVSADAVEIRRVAKILEELGLVGRDVRAGVARILGIPKKVVFETLLER